MAVELTSGEASTWRLIQRLSDLATGVVELQIRSAADLSSAEFEVLRCLVDAPDRQLRQNELAALLGWDKSRLSHQLTRMQHRELIDRQKSGRVHAVAVTRTGVQKFELADNAHVAAVRSLLREHLSVAEREALERTAAQAVAAADAEEDATPSRPASTPRLRARTT
ncbi:MarR family winged helix-turn-helix transcriptional regulator [Amnibacterium setariae]|uniref:MarR family transcriptional regulator n=1 Tax=Amnibacterium setariae TaxID=2306585 RepID=A0A3A1U0J2_9MICO|nr:MarR family winged helix-turn-helix transcriptional regulator [Amnibacterium setariae]RIX30394.1 MarR family transcriptional regulator [Amnibacterium setariae]